MSGSVREHDAELTRLLSALCDGMSTDAEIDRLESLMRADSAARRLYRRYMDMAAEMTVRCKRTRSERPLAARAERPAADPRRHLTFVWWAAAALLVGVAIAVAQVARSTGATPAPETTPAPIAVLLDAVGVAWTSEPINTGEGVAPGRIAIGSGVLELELHHGASVALAGPADFELRRGGVATLRAGHLHARIAPGGDGLTVDSPHGRVVDLGTEFALTVEADRTLVHVFDGAVSVTTPTDRRRLAAEESVIVLAGGSVQDVAVVERARIGARARLMPRGVVLEERFDDGDLDGWAHDGPNATDPAAHGLSRHNGDRSADGAGAFLRVAADTRYRRSIVDAMTPGMTYSVEMWVRSIGSSYGTGGVALVVASPARDEAPLGTIDLRCDGPDPWARHELRYTAGPEDAGRPLGVVLTSTRRGVPSGDLAFDDLTVVETLEDEHRHPPRVHPLTTTASPLKGNAP